MTTEALNIKKREKWLDIVKAIAVSAVVFHHAGFPVMFLNMVFVSVFFVTSGYVFKKQKFIDFIKKQFLRLWVPFVISNIVILLGHNLLCALGLWQGNPYGVKAMLILIGRSLLFVEADSLCAPQWFVFMIFAANVAYYGLYNLIKTINEKYMDIVLGIICLVMYVLGIIFAPVLNKIMWGNSAFITNVFVGMILYYAGYECRKYKLVEKISSLRAVVNIVIFVLCTSILMSCYVFGYVADHRAGIFTMPWIVPVITIMGMIWMILLAKGVIERIPFVSEIVAFIGENSLYVMLFHGLAFQIVTFIQVKICHIPYDPGWIWQNIYMGSGLWVVSAGLVGTLAPVGIRWVYLAICKEARKSKN